MSTVYIILLSVLVCVIVITAILYLQKFKLENAAGVVFSLLFLVITMIASLTNLTINRHILTNQCEVIDLRR